ncbi:MAG TPA: orotidine-5'-phosphate decarboxylase [Terriglobales bacterium]|nr:orotidine-5'-phosphate decarboxylase [Terriglobales bacterium]
MTSPKDRLIVALDVPTAVDAQEIVYELGDSVSFYKVGLQLFTAEGPKIVSELVSSGRKIFLDLKLHDIPNTVAGAVKSAAELGVTMLTAHAAGGSKMLTAAVEAAKQAPQPLTILAVTVLTSFGEEDLRESGVQSSIPDQVLHLAMLAKSTGCGGIVTSARESKRVRSALGPDMAIVTPGIRPAGADLGDQSRVATPTAAIQAGASHVVVGRPILSAPNRNQAAAAIVRELSSALRTAEMEMAGTRPA